MPGRLEIVIVPERGHVLHDLVDARLHFLNEVERRSDDAVVARLKIGNVLVGFLEAARELAAHLGSLSGKRLVEERERLLFLFEFGLRVLERQYERLRALLDAVEAFHEHGEIGRHASRGLGERVELLEFLFQQGDALTRIGGEGGKTVLEGLRMLDDARKLGVVRGKQRVPGFLHALGRFGGPFRFRLLGFFRGLGLAFGLGLGCGLGLLLGVGLFVVGVLGGLLGVVRLGGRRLRNGGTDVHERQAERKRDGKSNDQT